MNDGNNRGLLVVASRKAEIKGLLSNLNFQPVESRNNVWHLPASNQQITALVTGIGPGNIKKTTESFSASFFERPLFITGSCGATDDKNRKHNLYFPDTISGTDTLRTYPSEKDLQEKTRETLKNLNFPKKNIISGHLYSVNSPAVKPEERRRIYEKYSAEAIDMETHFLINNLSQKEDSPEWFGFRIVSDTPEDNDMERIKELQNSACQKLNRLLVKLFKTPGWLENFTPAGSSSPLD